MFQRYTRISSINSLLQNKNFAHIFHIWLLGKCVERCLHLNPVSSEHGLWERGIEISKKLMMMGFMKAAS